MAVMPAAMRLRAAGAARARNETGSAIPYDAAASFELQGKPGRVVAGVINIDVDGTFVATAIGYGLEEDCRRAFELPVIVPFGTDTAGETFRLGDIRLGDIPPDVLIDGFRVRPDPAFIDGNTTGPRVPLDRVIAQASRSNVLEHRVPRSDVSFFFSLIDSNSGRELQDEPVNNLASLGKANGERPFRVLPQPLSFAPRSTVRLQVIENSEGVRGTLFIVLYGYKLLAASHCPEPVVRALRASADCPGEIIGLPTDHVTPFDYVANVPLTNRPGRLITQEVHVNVEGGFVATGIGYALQADITALRPSAAIRRFVESLDDDDAREQVVGESGEINLANLPLSLFGAQALEDGFRIRPSLLRVALQDGGRLSGNVTPDLIDKLFESLNQAEDVSFRYTLFDGGTGRELQNGLINNVAGLGIADGDRPFKRFARPMIFYPRSTIRVHVQENFGRGRLYLVFQGYKLSAAAGASAAPLRTRRRAR
jgi:hypothetical protein